jgi:hypothetical protein
VLWVVGATFSWWFPIIGLMRDDIHPTAASPDALVALARASVLTAAVILLLTGLAAQLPARSARWALLVLGVVDLALLLQPYRITYADPQEILAQGAVLQPYDRAAVVGNDLGLGNYGPVLRVVQPSGYTSLFSSQYAALVTGSPNPGVAVRVNELDDPVLPLLGYRVAFDPQEGLLAFLEQPGWPAIPRAWVAHCVWPGAALEVRQVDFPRQMCVARAGATRRDELAPPGPATLLAEAAGRLTLEAAGPGWLVTAQPWYPGWSAQIDGAPASVEAVDGALVGVELPSGTHRVSLDYRPAGFDVGLLISMAASVVLLVLWWSERSDRPRQPVARLLRRLGRMQGRAVRRLAP